MTVVQAIVGYFSCNLKYIVSVLTSQSKIYPFGLPSVILTLASYWVDDSIKCEGSNCCISETQRYLPLNQDVFLKTHFVRLLDCFWMVTGGSLQKA